jgi:hypothetical protein
VADKECRSGDTSAPRSSMMMGWGRVATLVTRAKVRPLYFPTFEGLRREGKITCILLHVSEGMMQIYAWNIGE